MEKGLVIKGDPHEAVCELAKLLHILLQVNQVVVDTHQQEGNRACLLEAQQFVSHINGALAQIVQPLFELCDVFFQNV